MVLSQLRLATVQEPQLQASRWLFSQILIDAEEMAELFNVIGECFLFKLGTVCKPGDEGISINHFLNAYSEYIENLKQGTLEPSSIALAPYALTKSIDALCAVQVAPDKHIVRVVKPVVQIQGLTLDYSSLDKKYRTMIMGGNTITWGVQFSFPQLTQDRNTQEVIRITAETDPNAQLFKTLQRWVRNFTSPTPMIAEGQTTNLSVRLGKRCFSWINHHPQLKKKGLEVKRTKENTHE